VTNTGKQNIMGAFEKLEKNAVTKWRNLVNSGKPVIMVGAATCGRAAGAFDVLQSFREEIDRQGIDCPVIEVGCM
jgi:NADH-quinone oxidoreductase subunit F